MAPSVDDDGLQRALNSSEARLIYVAVTRARHQLDTEGIAWIDAYETTMASAGRDGTVAGRPMIELSLTGQLRYETSPVSHFMAQRLPYSQNLIRDYLGRIAHLPHPVQPIDVQHPNWSALGHAIDYRLRLSLGGRLGPAVALGVWALDGAESLRGVPGPESRKALHTAGRQLLAMVDAYLAAPGHIDDDALTRLCFVAGFFEDIARTGQIRRFSMLSGATPGTSLDDLTTAVPAYVLDDIGQQIQLADGPFTSFRRLPPQARVCGPVFSGSGDIGGADADYILGGLLLDCKATKAPATWAARRSTNSPDTCSSTTTTSTA